MHKRVRSILRVIAARAGFERDWYLIVVGATIGTVTGLVAVGFDLALLSVEHASREAQGGLPLALLFVSPVVGMGLTGLVVHWFASDARGHGVPQVIDAIVRRGGHIPARVGIVKAIASIATVGSGGSGGTEGPIVQVGATAGSVVGRRLGANRDQMGSLVGCGAAAGIASIFNAPIAGVFFVLEIILRDFSIKTFTPIVVAAVFSAATTQGLLGSNEAIFATAELHRGYQFRFVELPSYLVLGILAGLVAVGFNWMLHAGERTYARVNLHPAAKPVTGAVLLGAVGVLFVLLARVGGAADGMTIPPFFGNGYETIRWLVRPDAYVGAGGHALHAEWWILGLLVGFIAVATTLTLASGGSGGVFAPSLFLGASTGATFGLALESVGLMPEGGSPASYALVGMAAVVAGTMHAPLTAILMLLEVTRDIRVLVPIMLAAVIATVVAQLVMRDSVYTYNLRRAGVLTGDSRDLTLLRRIPVSSVERLPLPRSPIYPTDPLSKLIALLGSHQGPDFIVVDQDGRYIGLVTGADVRAALVDREAIPLLLVAELVRTDLPTITDDENLATVLDKFSRHDVASLPLVEGKDRSVPVALVPRAGVMKRYQQSLESS